MNVALFQAIVTLLSIYITLETMLYWGIIFLVAFLFQLEMSPNRKQSRIGQWPVEILHLLRQMAPTWIFKLLKMVVFFFPTVCMLPIVRWSYKVHLQTPSRFHIIAKICKGILILALVLTLLFSMDSFLSLTWMACLYWVWMIEQIVDDYKNDSEDDNGRNDPNDPDPTPSGDAAELWGYSEKCVESRQGACSNEGRVPLIPRTFPNSQLWLHSLQRVVTKSSL